MSKLKLWWTSGPFLTTLPRVTLVQAELPASPPILRPAAFSCPIPSSLSPEVLFIFHPSLPHLVLWGFLPLYQAVFSHSRSRPCCHSLPGAHTSRCLCTRVTSLTWTIPLTFRFTQEPSEFSLTPQPHISNRCSLWSQRSHSNLLPHSSPTLGNN